MVKLALSMYGHMYAELSAALYRGNALRAMEVVSHWGVEFTSAHVSGAPYPLRDLFDTVTVLQGASVDTASNLARMREKLSSVFATLTAARINECLLMRIDVYVDALAPPPHMGTAGLHTVNNQHFGPWDGLIYGPVNTLHGCGLQDRAAGQPEALLVDCCRKQGCRQFSNYEISLVKPANGTKALRSQQVRTWTRTAGQPSRHHRRNLTDFFEAHRRRLATLPRLNTTAVVAVGGLRSLIFPDVARNLQTHVLRPLSADLFLYLDPRQIQWASKLDYTAYNRCATHARMPQASGASLQGYLEELSPLASGEFNDCEAFGDVLPHTTANTSALWRTAAERVRPEACGFFKYRRCMAQFLWADEAFALVRAHERARGQPYEWVVKVRPDMVFHQPLQLPRRGGSVVYGYHYRAHMILDWWAVMARDVAERYFSMGRAMRSCDLLGWDPRALRCSGLKKDDVECFLYRWMASHGIRVDNRWGNKFDSTLVHVEGNARTFVTAASFAAG